MSKIRLILILIVVGSILIDILEYKGVEFS